MLKLDRRRLAWPLLLTSFVGTARTLTAQDETAAPLAPFSWLRLGAEGRFRSELESFQIAGQEPVSNAIFLRLRLRGEVTPLHWLRLVVQLQDARTLLGPVTILGDLQDNHMDVQYGYAELGARNERWGVRAGRQPLAFGDERLVGADTSWDNRGQAIDGIRAWLSRGEWRWDIFSAHPVRMLSTDPDPIGGRELFSGVYGSWKKGHTKVEPYVVSSWVRTSAATGMSSLPSNLWTSGMRVVAPVGLGFEAVTEMALQRGSYSELGRITAPVSAWAGYWELGYPFSNDTARIRFSYTQASGGNIGDRRVGTFNDLHPAGFNDCGFFEPFAWRNIRNLGAGGRKTAFGKWNLTAEFHIYWLASLKDGVYIDEGPYVAFNPYAASSRLGSRLLAGAQRNFGSHFETAFGYAKFFRADYLKAGTAISHSAFISWTARL
jgi:hypothetical protein